MATLNVKNLPDDLYDKLRVRARRKRRSVSQEVINLLSRYLAQEPDCSLESLKGLGKELWAGVDASRHVHEERDAWD